MNNEFLFTFISDRFQLKNAHMDPNNSQVHEKKKTKMIEIL